MSRPPGATVGGQAVIEGVMMRAPNRWAVAVRRPDGVIEAASHELPRLSARSRWAKVPFVRDVLVRGRLLPHLLTDQGTLSVSYNLPVLMPSVSYRFPFEEVALSRRRSVVIERHPACTEQVLDRRTLQRLLNLHVEDRPKASEDIPEAHPEELLQWEKVGWGLQEYF